MRPVLLALAVGAVLAAALPAADPSPAFDAALHAVQFLNREEGWAVGDDGVVWQTIDSGKTWERRTVGTRASLRSLHFLNPLVGWIVGREELPHGGSAGVLFLTGDGGVRWRRVAFNQLPGLHRVRFTDPKNGFVVGDAAEQYPSGVFATNDGGRTWHPVAGPRCPGWLAADFLDEKVGALGGPWNRLATLRNGEVFTPDVDELGGRSVRGLQVAGRRGVAVGQGGLVLLNDNIAGHASTWGVPDTGLPLPLRACWDFHAVCVLGQHIWCVGRPGSAVLHSGNGGAKWEILTTQHPLPLNAIHFVDESHGWAVGELGAILVTTDGGKTWKAQQRGGQRAAVLMVHARPSAVPLEVMAILGGEEGYLTTALRVPGADPKSAPPSKASEGQRLAAAVRLAGGAAGETLWQFPLPQHLGRADKADLLASWDKLHGGKGAEQVLRQLVLALRMWKPAVVITDNPDLQATHSPVEALLAEAVHEAFKQAADPNVFPEQIRQLGLEPWQPVKLYACWADKDGANVTVDLNNPSPRLGATPRDRAAAALALLSETTVAPATKRHFKLLASKLDGAEKDRWLMDGIALAAGGLARRELKPVEAPEEVMRAVRERRNLEVLAAASGEELIDPARVLGLVKPALEKLPAEQGVPAAFAVAGHYVRTGQWHLAREIYLQMVDRHPIDPLSAEAYRWLIKHGGSSEARRRHELGQFLVLTKTEVRGEKLAPVQPAGAKSSPDGEPHAVLQADGRAEMKETQQTALLSQRAEVRRWFQGSLELESRLAAFGPLYADDPGTQLVLQAARRQLGDFETARKWYTRFVQEQPDGPRRQTAQAELWLANRSGPPPRPVAPCRPADERPFLDGKLDEALWQAHKPLVLRDAVGETAQDYKTEVWLAYDKDFLYLAARCGHPAGKTVEKVAVRPRDADVRPFDHLDLLLDLDRDYATYFRLQADQRGCVCEDCWGDITWNPRWFVAVESGADGWALEAAIPMTELTGDAVTTGKVWAANVARVLPGRGVQALSLPADAIPRPEGMGLLMFMQEPRPAPQGEKPAVPMDRLP